MNNCLFNTIRTIPAIWFIRFILAAVLSGLMVWCVVETYAFTPSQQAIFRNWLDPNGVGDFTGDGVCNLQDFALAAGRKRDFMNKAIIWGKWSGKDANDHTASHKVCLQNLAIYIAESNSITKVDRRQRTIDLQNLYAKLWMEWE